VLGHRDGSAGRVHEAPLRLRVEHRAPPREVGHDGQGQAGQLLAAGPEQEGEAPHDAVPVGGDVGESLIEGAAPQRRGGPHEGLELLRHARARIEGARALRHQRHDHVARAPHRLGEASVLGPGGVEEDREGDDPGRRGRERVEGLGVERAGPGRQGAVARQQRLVALLIDADDHSGAGRLDRARREEQVAHARAGGREQAEQKGAGQHERHPERGEAAREEAGLLASGEGSHRPTVISEISGGTRKRTGTMLVPMPGVTKRSRPFSCT